MTRGDDCQDCGQPEADHATSGLCEPQAAADVRNHIVDMIDGLIDRWRNASGFHDHIAAAKLIRDTITRNGRIDAY